MVNAGSWLPGFKRECVFSYIGNISVPGHDQQSFLISMCFPWSILNHSVVCPHTAQLKIFLSKCVLKWFFHPVVGIGREGGRQSLHGSWILLLLYWRCWHYQTCLEELFIDKNFHIIPHSFTEHVNMDHTMNEYRKYFVLHSFLSNNRYSISCVSASLTMIPSLALPGIYKRLYFLTLWCEHFSKELKKLTARRK